MALLDRDGVKKKDRKGERAEERHETETGLREILEFIPGSLVSCWDRQYSSIPFVPFGLCCCSTNVLPKLLSVPHHWKCIRTNSIGTQSVILPCFAPLL